MVYLHTLLYGRAIYIIIMFANIFSTVGTSELDKNIICTYKMESSRNIKGKRVKLHLIARSITQQNSEAFTGDGFT